MSAALITLFAVVVVLAVVWVCIAEMRDERRYNDWRRQYDQDQHDRWYRHRNWNKEDRDD